MNCASGRITTELRSSFRELARATNHSIGSITGASLISLVVLCVAGTALRIYYLFQPMRYDEAFTYDEYASRPFSVFLRDYSYPNNHIFHSILVHCTTRLFGGEPWAIRLPALIAGILLIPVTAWLFNYFFGTLVGLLAAALVACSSILLEYSINARGYSILTLIFLVLVALTSYLRRHTNLAGWIAFVLLAALGFYTIPTMLYPFGMLIGWLLLSALLENSRPESRRLIVHTLLAAGAVMVLTFILYSPVILYHGIRPLVGNTYVEPLTWSQFLHGWPTSLRKLWIQWNRGLPTKLGLLISLGVILYVALQRRIDKRGFWLLLASLFWCIVAVFLQRVIPFERVWIFLVPVYLALGSAGFVAIFENDEWPKCLALAVPILVFVGVSLFVIRSRSVVKSGEAFPDGPQVATFFNAELVQGDRVVAGFPADQILPFYARKQEKLRNSLYLANSSNPRVLIVVSTSDQTPQRVLKDNRVATTEFETPRLVKKFAIAAVYEARRLRPESLAPAVVKNPLQEN